MFSCEFCEIFYNTFFTEHLRATVSVSTKEQIHALMWDYLIINFYNRESNIIVSQTIIKFLIQFFLLYFTLFYTLFLLYFKKACVLFFSPSKKQKLAPKLSNFQFSLFCNSALKFQGITQYQSQIIEHEPKSPFRNIGFSGQILTKLKFR